MASRDTSLKGKLPASRLIPGKHRADPALSPAAAEATRRPQQQGAALPIAESNEAAAAGAAPKKKRRRKRKNRRQSFASHDVLENNEVGEGSSSRSRGLPSSQSGALYRLGQAARSNTSLESEGLLDHRNQDHHPHRRTSVWKSEHNDNDDDSPSRPGISPIKAPTSHDTPSRGFAPTKYIRSKLFHSRRASEHSDDNRAVTDRTPLMTSWHAEDQVNRGEFAYGSASSHSHNQNRLFRRRSNSATSSRSGLRQSNQFPSQIGLDGYDDFDVNNPPSVPASPTLGTTTAYDAPHGFDSALDVPGLHDAVIDVDGDADGRTPSGMSAGGMERRRRATWAAEEDVCLPIGEMSVIGEEDEETLQSDKQTKPRRRRGPRWPHLNVLEEWSLQEQEFREMDNAGTRKVSEPLMVNGRLRPRHQGWHREDDEAVYRWTYFNEVFTNTIHSRTISELVQPGQTFQDLFIPEPAELEDSSSESESEAEEASGSASPRVSATAAANTAVDSAAHSRTNSTSTAKAKQPSSSGEPTRSSTPTPKAQQSAEKPRRFGDRPIFWLDVLCPTEAEMKILQRTFGIHPLTAEDIMMQEAREKVELFKNYYFVNYRTFDQDVNDEDYMEPINLYAVVFREGVISFHFSPTPHPANVRRRIRQLSDYLILSSDWLSYAVIDDITDVYGPLVHSIEEEVSAIDDEILKLHITGGVTSGNTGVASTRGGKTRSLLGTDYEKVSTSSKDSRLGESAAHMLVRVGECRKKVMGLYRLLANKADVIKGFAKRCNEQWEVAPRSEIGLYLGDIQDHLVTMTASLSHCESLLSRAHHNYLAQINIRMNERAEETADTLGKLTVLGTILLPATIVSSIMGMNVLVPGQDVPNLRWFFGIVGVLFTWIILCVIVAKRAKYI